MSSAPAIDPFRALFDQLGAGAARCRIDTRAREPVIEVVDENLAFGSFRSELPHLATLLGRVQMTGRAETIRFQTAAALTLSASVYPVGDSEVMVVFTDVSAGEESERKSRAAQGRFQQAFHGNAAAMVIAHQEDLRIVDVNPRWLEMFGATREDVIGKRTVDLGLISEDKARERVGEHRRFTGGYETELPLFTRAGVPITVLASAKPITIAEGPCTLTTLIDITARKQAEEAFETAFRSSPAGMLLVHAPSDTIVSANDHLLRLTNFTREELVGSTLTTLSLIVSPSREALFDELQRKGNLREVEVQLINKSGPNVWALASTEQITLHDIPHRLSVFTDITDRKRIESRLLAQHIIGRTLAEATELDVALPAVLETLCRAEAWPCGEIWLAPRAGDRSLGVPGLRATWHGCGDASHVLGPVESIDPATAPPTITLPIRHGSDQFGTVVMQAGPPTPPLDASVRGFFESATHMLGLFVERTHAETSLRELNAELERRVLERTQELADTNRDLEEFTSTVSHDLRAPLRTIHGFSAALLEDFSEQLPGDATRMLTRIHQSGDRLKRLVDDLLEFSRLGRKGVRRARVDFDALVRSVADELLAARDIDDRLDLQIAPLGIAHADPSLLRAVWTNLLDNAFKYSRTRDHIVIRVGREERDGHAVYFVQDNGVGFDPDQADRLFGVFQRLHTAAEFEGTGVGLANVRRIIERHRGLVAATSELGVGARFEFTLGEA